MKATVVTPFTDVITNRVFNIGDDYPLENVDAVRIELLSKPHPSTKKIYIFVDELQEKPRTTRGRKKATNAGEEL